MPSPPSSTARASTWRSPGAPRWDKGAEASIALGSDGKDYINCPMNKAQYLAFREELLAARRPSSRVGGQHALFRRLHAGEVMAERGEDTCASAR
jgi:methylenetetrahydrofolate--tRNA-(uracil-5-)-methyltransferase